MTQAAQAEELEFLTQEGQAQEEDEAKRKTAEEEEGAKADDGGADGANEPKAEDIKKQLFEKVGLDPETEEPKPPEKKEESQAPVQGQTEEDLKDLPKEITGDNRKFFIMERIKARKQREEEAARKAEEERREIHEGERHTEASKRSEEDKPLTEADYMTALAWAAQAQDVLDGAYRENLPEAKAHEILKAANTILAQIADPTLLTRLRGRIQTGDIPKGVDMRSVLALVDREMPFVQARAMEFERTSQTQKQAIERAKGAFSEALKATYEQYPEFRPPAKGAKGSPEHEFALKTMKELTEAEISVLYTDPAKQLPRLMRRIKAEFMLEKNEQIAAENKALKNRLERGKAPLSGGGSTSRAQGRTSGEETSEDIKHKLEEKTGLTL